MGLTTAWKNPLHPYTTYVSIATDPAYRHCDVEGQLLKRVESHETVEHPLQTSFWEANDYLKSFHRSVGFKEIRKTYEPTLEIPSFQYFVTQTDQIMTFKQISTDQLLRRNVVQLVQSTYEQTHKANPPATFDVNKWDHIVFNTDTLLEGSFILTQGDDVFAFAMLHKTEKSKTLELGWRGSQTLDDIPSILLLTEQQIAYAKKHGFHYLEAEVDTTDPDFTAVLEAYPFSSEPAWVTYQKR
ncbi:hypothetical protein ACE1TF_03790 [Geomicrobium sp. JSM 1781026]|uniref:hypothetical protein n=1 Tax=Geomicrobium sp. JSM 1781026 TaxID=3344580 RepID=UPI0035BF1304